MDIRDRYDKLPDFFAKKRRSRKSRAKVKIKPGAPRGMAAARNLRALGLIP